MRLLLDTNLVLWTLTDSLRIPTEIRESLGKPEAEVYLSIVSLWEIAIKSSLGKLEFDSHMIWQSAQESNFGLLDLTPDHCRQVESLPKFHRDPFDRMLIAQSLAEPMILLTSDRALAAYGSTVRPI